MSSEDDELLTEEGEDDYEPTPGKKEFTIYRPLDPPITKQWSIEDLHSLMHQGLIDLEAPYQREVVWPDNKKIGLIDSIFRNYCIPPVIFAIHENEDGEEIRVCVDGKQRLTSVVRFMDGQIPHRDPKTKKNYWFTRSGSQTSRTLLPETFRKKFKRKQLTCIEYSNLSPGDEREYAHFKSSTPDVVIDNLFPRSLFQRVQLGMSLTPAEKLQAISSDATEWISTLQRRFITAENGLEQNLKWSVARGRDFAGIAQLCYCCWHLPQYAFPSNAKLEKWLHAAPAPSKTYHKQMQRVLESYVNLSLKEDYRQGFTDIKERVAPVEFVMIGVLLAKMRNCSWEDRAEQILAMRKHVRSLYKDIRANERVMKAMWIFIDQISIKGATFEDWESPVATARKTTQKRRRDDAGDSMDQAGYHSKVQDSGAGAKSKIAKLPKRTDGNGVRFVA